VAYLAGELGPAGRDPDSSRSLFDPHLRALEDAVHAALLPEVGEIGAERSEPLGRKLEVERLRKRDRGRRR
jgi:hypothetical protein